MQFNPERLILGCANLGGLFLDGEKPDTSRAETILSQAAKLGIFHFETAPLYGWGASEYFLGRAIEAIGLKRDKICIASKSLRSIVPCVQGKDSTQPDFWTLGEPNARFTHQWKFNYDAVMQTTVHSMEVLRTSTIDELSFHDIGDAFAENKSLSWETLGEAIRACEDLKKTGFVKKIGFGSKETETLPELVKRYPSLLSYVSTTTYNLLDQEFSANGMFQFCKERGLAYRVAGPYCSRLLAADPRTATYRAGKDGVSRWYFNNNLDQPVTFNYRYITQKDYDRACRLWSLLEEFGETSPRAVAMQFVLAHPQVDKVVIGASVPEHLVELKKDIERTINPKLWDALKKEKIIHSEAPVPK